MGGAMLGVVCVLAYRYPATRTNKLAVVLGAVVGNVNAFFCNQAPLLYWDIPRDHVTSWTHAAITFFFSVVCVFAGFTLVDHVMSFLGRRR
ncbi:hypothetical protein V7x_54200 [Crateriforma conspicua]|uniref:Uncharacterized protein n=2 Tax=Crateriforma conspicua TaxID=2527996 RepID=A0A5C6FKH6_9PLAN|nr:hypothetical protein V7x_54200 [Crateriforma conspicua]